MNFTIGTYTIDARVAAKVLIFIFIALAVVILLYSFIVHGIDWVGFIEFIASSLLLISLVEKINIKVPGLFEIQNELGEIRKNLSVVAKNISNVKVSQKVTNITPTYYEGPPIDLTDSMLSTGTVDTMTQEEVDDEDEENQ